MSDPRYRINLYGHSSEDPYFFVMELAAILEIHPEEAREFLNSTPVTIKENVSEEEAEYLGDLLKAVRALVIVEPMDGVPEKTPDKATEVSVLKKQLEEQEDRAAFRSYLWVGSAMLIALIVLVWLTTAFWSSFSKTSEENAKKPAVEETDAKKPERTVTETPQQPDLSKLYSVIDEADSNVEQTQFLLKISEEDLYRLQSTYMADQKAVRQKKVQVAELRAKLRSEKTALQKLKDQVKRIESSLKVQEHSTAE
ncbi:hypothetical protein [Desulfomonile tiedjei]|uniref:Ribosomal protein L7/L12 n=1 Tax=Desulfomonile tiedjei (strain ATCC 49306 / DSM 6799 / DCB-1) TaxID=706587 RepID=I4C8B8_DESTA|nr:hypothetical protein [Desulfomonile tiedjei]AFM25809.1 Ribosomal protein L7/L12 [Desulfomonile tiedjei DSM 6799]